MHLLFLNMEIKELWHSWHSPSFVWPTCMYKNFLCYWRVLVWIYDKNKNIILQNSEGCMLPWQILGTTHHVVFLSFLSTVLAWPKTNILNSAGQRRHRLCGATCNQIQNAQWQDRWKRCAKDVWNVQRAKIQKTSVTCCSRTSVKRMFCHK